MLFIEYMIIFTLYLINSYHSIRIIVIITPTGLMQISSVELNLRLNKEKKIEELAINFVKMNLKVRGNE